MEYMLYFILYNILYYSTLYGFQVAGFKFYRVWGVSGLSGLGCWIFEPYLWPAKPTFLRNYL